MIARRCIVATTNCPFMNEEKTGSRCCRFTFCLEALREGGVRF